ncbi:MAG: hypothetical protein GX206_07630 [Clostridiales bacterium]|mgnify:FL=1|nr:hypothetical protein [Clostridiales bacterium]
MNKPCIFNKNKNCDDCSECDICDLDPNKICDSCGSCLEINNNDYKRVLVDDIYESKELDEDDILLENSEPLENNLIPEEYEYLDISDDQDVNVEFIDDIEGLRDLLEDKDSKMLDEVTPGLFVLKNLKKELH